MSHSYRLCNNCAVNRFILFAIFLVLLGFVAYLSYFRQLNSHHAEWPVIGNIKDQVDRELAGEENAKIYRFNNWEDFFPLAQPIQIANCTNKTLLIIIKSGPKRADRREAYRKVLPKFEHLDGYDVQRLFVMGLNANETFNGSLLEVEAAINDDVLIGNFSDHYHNNTYKFMHSLKFARNYCSNSHVPFVILLDDDFVFNLENAVKMIKEIRPDYKLYSGNNMNGSPPIRNNHSKYYVSMEEYPFKRFPPYVSGGCVIYSPKAIKDFYIAAQYLKMFKFDDVYEGMIASQLNYTLTHTKHVKASRKDSGHWNEGKIAEHGYNAKEILNTLIITNSSRKSTVQSH